MEDRVTIKSRRVAARRRARADRASVELAAPPRELPAREPARHPPPRRPDPASGDDAGAGGDGRAAGGSIDDMFETMYAARGIGLAAPQVGRIERALRRGRRRPTATCSSIRRSCARERRADRRGGLPVDPRRSTATSSAPQHVVGARARSLDGAPFEIDGDRPARALPAARDRSSARQLFIDYLSLLKRHGGDAKWKKLRGKDKSLDALHRRRATPQGTHDTATRSSECACSSGARRASPPRRSAR